MNERDVDALRAALQGRIHRCWERLDDAVSELVEVHGVPADEVVARVRGLADDAP